MLAEAARHIGTREIPGVRSSDKIRAWIVSAIPWLAPGDADDSAWAWCGCFVRHLAVVAGVTPPAKSYRALQWAGWGVAVALADIAPGDVVVSSRGRGLFHVSLFERWADSSRTLWVSLGGNQGYAVSRVIYQRAKIYAVRRAA